MEKTKWKKGVKELGSSIESRQLQQFERKLEGSNIVYKNQLLKNTLTILQIPDIYCSINGLPVGTTRL